MTHRRSTSPCPGGSASARLFARFFARFIARFIARLFARFTFAQWTFARLACALLASGGTFAFAQGSEAVPALASAPAPTHTTVETLFTHGRLTAGLPDADALNVRGTWVFDGGDVARAEILDERKFGSRGGIGAISYTKVLSADWFATGSVALGHGGPNWANARADVELSTKWGEQRSVVTRAALYQARFDNDRSDRGLRLAVVGYLPGSVVLEAGVTFNISEPGAVRSQMPFVSATVGSDGVQYVSVRASSGSEAYQAIGAGQQLVDFNSRSLGLGWRRWVSRQWGFIAQAEHYRNPSYERNTFGAGVFVQW